ncbi:ribosome biogenesis GTPase YlqF [Sporolituus thermophilus]|uniref:Ribosome biogenesis GTPase A n=1 Tax=Sporolituus thermophilus DSM 23256 TaxID=1123285 RepID=A0A1G7NU89_9FIRM|nr:ribosome biogenesis GTPase YlqF [Sporolituus thermophilus]SDF77477.1 ribosome biogenesis GTPase A [Sporolituus thermophilus DSM 23256]
MHIHWFPGHMAKAHKMIREHLKLVDVVIELLDARIPLSSANPVIHELVENKPRVIALNKADLAEPEWTQRWIAEYRRQGLAAVPLEAVSGKGAKTLLVQVETAVRPKLKALEAKGIQGRTVRAIILGIPNVGKSSLINRLLGAAVVRTGDRPGVTRGQQWIKIGKNLELLDTPGVLWPKFDDQEVAFKLAITGAIHEDVYDVDAVATKLLHVLRACYADRLVERFKLSPPLPEDAAALLDLIGSKRGCLRAGGIVDHEKVRRIILTEFRTGKLGPFTLDYPPVAKNI